MNKKLKKILFIIVFLLIGGLFIFNRSGGWLYVKFDGKVYVANTGGGQDYSIGKQLGCVQNKIPKLIKPYIDNQSNGFPYGTEIYDSEYPNQIFIKYGDKYYPLQDIDKAENWGNGINVKIRNNKIVFD